MHSEHTPQEVRKLILDREARRSRIEVIVAANTKVEYRKREDNEIRRGKTSSAIVVIKYKSSEMFFQVSLLLLRYFRKKSNPQ
jgi:hypothetical protein